MQAVQGLTEAEARARRERGEGNNVGMPAGRSYWDIIRSNLFNFFNNILYAIGIALIALGQYNDAIISVGQGLVNAIIGTLQELNAKRKLDQIALLTRTTVTVIRDGREQAIDLAGLVRGDCMRVQAGDQSRWSGSGRWPAGDR
jgi:cation-transporting ATPase E